MPSPTTGFNPPPPFGTGAVPGGATNANNLNSGLALPDVTGAVTAALGGLVGALFSTTGGFFQGFGQQLLSNASGTSGKYLIALVVAMVVVFVLFR